MLLAFEQNFEGAVMTPQDYRDMADGLEALGTDNYYVPTGGESLKDSIAALHSLADETEAASTR